MRISDFVWERFDRGSATEPSRRRLDGGLGEDFTLYLAVARREGPGALYYFSGLFASKWLAGPRLSQRHTELMETSSWVFESRARIVVLLCGNYWIRFAKMRS
jgi:hypothetical protein